MKIQEIITELRMGHSDLTAITADDMLFGFESEIFVRRPNYGSAEFRKQFAEKIQKDVGFTFTVDNYGYTPDKGRREAHGWYMDEDSSIKDVVDGEAGEHGSVTDFEIVSPPMEYEEFFKYIKKFFQFYEDNHVETNETTGFHINISFKDKEKTKSIDTLKLMLFMGENYLKSTFARLKKTSDSNLLSRINPLIDLINHDTYSSYVSDKNLRVPSKLGKTKNINKYIKTLIDLLNSQMNNNGRVFFKDRDLYGGSKKSFTVALHRLQEKGYVEFRVVGGKNYHKRFDEIKKTVNRFVKIFHAASDKELYKNEYYKKIAKLIYNAGIESEEPNQAVEIATRQNPNMLKAFYYIEDGHWYPKNHPERNDPDYQVSKEPDDVCWRMIEFVDENIKNNLSPTINRAIYMIRKKYNIDNAMILRLIKDKLSYSSLRNPTEVCHYFGIPRVPRVKKKEPDYLYDY